MREEEFWTLTPRILQGLFRRQREAEESDRRHREWCAGTVAAVAANPYRKEGSPALVPADFFPSLREEADATAAAEEPQTPETMLALAVELNTLFGGRDLRPTAQ